MKKMLMNILNRNMQPSATEEVLYEIVAQEIEDHSIKKGLYTKAMVDSNGDEKQAISIYIKWRVVQLNEELEAMQEEERLLDRKRLQDEYDRAEDEKKQRQLKWDRIDAISSVGRER